MRILTKLLLALTAAAWGARAADFETWHAVEPEILATSRLNLVIQGQFRERYNFGEFFQARVGPILRVRALPYLTITGGYYYRDNESTSLQWKASHRPFGGVEVPILNRKIKISGRVLVERFIGDSTPDYTRFREFIRFSTGRKVAPFMLAEAFQTPKGFAILRTQGGIRWRMRSRTSLELGYLHDSYQRWHGQNRQAVLTTLRFHLGTHPGD